MLHWFAAAVYQMSTGSVALQQHSLMSHRFWGSEVGAGGWVPCAGTPLAEVSGLPAVFSAGAQGPPASSLLLLA